MAKTNDKAQMAKANEDTSIDLSKLAQFLPEGFDLSDFDTIGGLRPICAPEVNQGTPIMGYIVAELPMPVRKDGSAWSALLVRLISPAKAKAGNEVVTVEPGKDVLIPMGGNLGNNADLRNFAADAKNVFVGIFTVTGQQDVDKPSPMWVYDVKVNAKKPVARTGAFALYNKPAVAQLQGHASGEVLNGNGQPVKSLIGASA